MVLAGANKLHGHEADGDDGILTGLEIVDLDLSGTELAVLSACDTGIGEVQDGNGVVGLRHAFQLADVDVVLASLWRLTAVMITDFWKQMANGNDASEAIRAAQLKFIMGRRQARKAVHPFLWAGFTITGQTEFNSSRK
jgi:CHAT domain-containing protein